MDVQHLLTARAGHPRQVCAAALLALGLSAPAQGEGLEALVGALIAAVQQDGSLDLDGFSCVQVLKDNDGIHDCRDPASGLGFLHIRDDQGDAMSVSVEKGPSGPTRAGTAVPDRAAFDRLTAEFVSLEYSPLLQGRTRCALQQPENPRTIAVRVEPAGLPMILAFGEPNVASAAALAQPGHDGTLLSAIAIQIRTKFDCKPRN